jgi:hypothetical protein
LAVSVLRSRRQGSFRRLLLNHFKTLAVWLFALVVVYVALWPGMWVAPAKMLYEVYGNALSYAFQGARLQVTQQLQPSEFGWGTIVPTAVGFLRDLLWRSTPVTWAGLILAFAGLFLPVRASSPTGIRRLLGYFLATAAVFVLMFSAAQGRNSPHYIMTSHISLDVIAALGWGSGITWLTQRWRLARAAMLPIGAIGALVAAQLGSSFACDPYFFTYFNPIAGRLAGRSIGYYYGEGLEQAAAYLASRPDATSLGVLAYPARGPFSYYFPGRTLILNPLFLEDPGMPSMFERLEQADYLVFYDALAARTANSARFVRALEDSQPERVISVQGIEQILIYRVADISPSFRAILAE